MKSFATQYTQGVITLCEDELLTITSSIGVLLLQNGAEIYRTEESMERIFHAYEANGNCFVIPSCIIVSLTSADGHTLTKTIRISIHGADFNKIILLNELCRRICRDIPHYDEILTEIEQIRQQPSQPVPIQFMAYSLVAFSFTLFFGGTFLDAISAAIFSLGTKWLFQWMDTHRVNRFFIHLAASFFSASLSILLAICGLGVHADKMILGAFMNLVPGVSITNAVRDVMAGDLLSGMTRAMDALLVGTAMALGAGTAFSIALLLWKSI